MIVERVLVTATEAAELLRISPRTLWQLTKEGEIPAVRIGRAVRYAIEDLHHWIGRKRG